MKLIVELSLTPQDAVSSLKYKSFISQKEKIAIENISGIRLLKRSIDARHRHILIHHTFEVFIDEPFIIPKPYDFCYKNVSSKPRVIIAGAGPSGLFAALRLIELGIKPVIIERGKSVNERKYDIVAINKKRIINPDSNYCFGEGGAGAFSDGKLYTRSTKRGDVNRILQIIHEHGASQNILVDSHPHIGTDKLPAIIASIRTTILDNGGEIHFNQRITDIIIRDGQAKGVKTLDGSIFEGSAVILATGHSARDIYNLLHAKNILIEQKSFAIGLRIEHPQQLIDSIQYHSKIKDPCLPAAIYSLACQSGEKGVFSFCMCPGGTIVTASTGQEELVLNGMSNSQRNLPFANSGIVVAVNEKDLAESPRVLGGMNFGPLAGLKFQEKIEKAAFIAGGSNLSAPAQRMIDFTEKKLSANLNKTSYHPGIISFPLHEFLPSFICECMQEAFKMFNKKMKGYLTNEATLLGVETRTSSPVRILRNPVSLEHIQIKSLYPCGEGAGYAGGIVSSAIDGERCAESAVKKCLS
ncbi:MAG: NAD(P)/FAD-dependent oxidoreductase [Bacteroidales bacterium]